MTDRPDKHKPLHIYNAQSHIPFPFPDDWLSGMASHKILLWSVSYGHITDTQFVSSIALSVTEKAKGLCGFMVITPIPRNIIKYTDQYPTGLISAPGRHRIVYVDSSQIFPTQVMMDIAGKTMNYGHILLGFTEKQLDSHTLATSKELLDIFSLMELSKYFVYIDLDGFMLIGLPEGIKINGIPDEIRMQIMT